MMVLRLACFSVGSVKAKQHHWGPGRGRIDSDGVGESEVAWWFELCVNTERARQGIRAVMMRARGVRAMRLVRGIAIVHGNGPD